MKKERKREKDGVRRKLFNWIPMKSTSKTWL